MIIESPIRSSACITPLPSGPGMEDLSVAPKALVSSSQAWKEVNKALILFSFLRIIFGDADPYLNKGVAQTFHEIFPISDLFLLPGARHYVQMDEPKEVARLILSTPVAERAEQRR